VYNTDTKCLQSLQEQPTRSAAVQEPNNAPYQSKFCSENSTVWLLRKTVCIRQHFCNDECYCSYHVHLLATCCKPPNINIISWVKPLQATLQFGLWAAGNDVKHLLSFATWTLSVVPRLRILREDAQWHWLVHKQFIWVPWRRGRWNPGWWIVASSTSNHPATASWCLRDRRLTEESSMMADNSMKERPFFT